VANLNLEGTTGQNEEKEGGEGERKRRRTITLRPSQQNNYDHPEGLVVVVLLPQTPL